MQPASSGETTAIAWGENGSPTTTTRSQVKARFTIGELAKEFGVTLRALRFYESKGLIAPHRQGLARQYSHADRDRIALILKGKKLGLTLGEIRELVALPRGKTEDALALSPDKCLEQIALLEQQKADIEAGLAELRRIYSSLSAKDD
jgi:DNA-binding transcriptional MerR regulator